MGSQTGIGGGTTPRVAFIAAVCSLVLPALVMGVYGVLGVAHAAIPNRMAATVIGIFAWAIFGGLALGGLAFISAIVSELRTVALRRGLLALAMAGIAANGSVVLYVASYLKSGI